MPKPSTAPSLASLSVKIALGAVLVMIAVRHIGSRGPAQATEEAAEVAGACGRHVPVVRHGPGSDAQPWALIGAGAATVVEAKLSSWESFLALLGYCVLASASYLAMDDAIIRPGQSRALLARFRTWINTRTDQVIIVGSLIIGLWLIADSIYLVISEIASRCRAMESLAYRMAGEIVLRCPDDLDHRGTCTAGSGFRLMQYPAGPAAR